MLDTVPQSRSRDTLDWVGAITPGRSANAQRKRVVFLDALECLMLVRFISPNLDGRRRPA